MSFYEEGSNTGFELAIVEVSFLSSRLSLRIKDSHSNGRNDDSQCRDDNSRMV